jgi:hypothetical protein
MYGRIESLQGLVHSKTSTLQFRIAWARTLVLVAIGPYPLANAVSVVGTAPRGVQ